MNENGQGLDEGYFEDNFKPMFEQPQPDNQWDMSNVPPMSEQPQSDNQENQANQGNKEKRPKAKKVITIALVIAMTTGIAVGANKIAKSQDESLDRSLERDEKRVEAYEAEKSETPEYVVDAENQTIVRNQQPEQYYEATDENRQNIQETWQNEAGNENPTTFMDGESE